MSTWSQTCLSIIDLVVSHLFVLGAYMGAHPVRVGTVSIWGNSLKPFDLLSASDTAMLIKFGLPGLGFIPYWAPCDSCESSPWCGQPLETSFWFKCQKLRCHDFSAFDRLVSKTDNVIHFARLVKQACVNLVSDLFVYYRLGCEPFVCSWGLLMLSNSMLHDT